MEGSFIIIKSMMGINNMSLFFKCCPVCQGSGELHLRQSRVVRLFTNMVRPLVSDKLNKCSYCKGTGKIYVKTNPTFKPWTKKNGE